MAMVQQRDKAYGQWLARRGWRDFLVALGQTISGHSRRTRLGSVDVMQKAEAYLRLLTCAVALRWYQLESGAYPTQLAELVPRYLPELPRDPFSAGSFVYRRTGDGFRLYSVGPNGKDEQGNSAGTAADDVPWSALMKSKNSE
ncbi:MAG: hypothetical protein HYY24_30310 [Verrucomicrobia bacterium]|nr:hypothetical protein [Verrucomicrobiota bacterium]